MSWWLCSSCFRGFIARSDCRYCVWDFVEAGRSRSLEIVLWDVLWEGFCRLCIGSCEYGSHTAVSQPNIPKTVGKHVFQACKLFIALVLCSSAFVSCRTLFHAKKSPRATHQDGRSLDRYSDYLLVTGCMPVLIGSGGPPEVLSALPAKGSCLCT